MAKLAVTPPVVGSVSTLMNGTRASSSRIRAAEILAICIRLTAPSCMRAPPEADTMMSGVRWASERSMARVIFSPTTAPMLPPMNFISSAQMLTVRPSSVPAAEMTAIGEIGLLAHGAQPVLVALGIHELQRVGGGKALVELLEGAIEEQPQPGGGVDA